MNADSGAGASAGAPGLAARGAIHVAIFALAFGVRCLYTMETTGLRAPVHDDAAQYDAIAWNLAQGLPYVAPDGYLSHRAPALPYVLAAVYRVTGHDLAAARIVQAAIGALTGCLVLAIGWRWFGIATGLMAGAAWAVFPYSLLWSTTLLSEPLCALLAAASTWAFLRASSGGTARAAAWGLLCALCALARPNMLPMLPLGLLALIVWRRRAGAAMAVFAFGLALLPWTARNYVVHGRFVPITTMGGMVLWEGNNPYVLSDPERRGKSGFAAAFPEAEATEGMSEVDKDAHSFRLAISFMAQNAGELPALMARKFALLWNAFPRTESVVQRLAAFITVVPMVLLFAAGLVLAWRRRDRRVIALLPPVAAVVITGVVYWADTRIRAPADPEILLVCAYAAGPFAERARARLRGMFGLTARPDAGKFHRRPPAVEGASVTESQRMSLRRRAASRLGLVSEIWAFMRARKKWWLGPLVVVLLLLGLLIVLTEGSALAPFIYTLF